MQSKLFFGGPFLIMIAASLWALDALLRGALIKVMPAASIVFYEHLIGFILLLPLFFVAFRPSKTCFPRLGYAPCNDGRIQRSGNTSVYRGAFAQFCSFDFATPVLY